MYSQGPNSSIKCEHLTFQFFAAKQKRGEAIILKFASLFPLKCCLCLSCHSGADNLLCGSELYWHDQTKLSVNFHKKGFSLGLTLKTMKPKDNPEMMAQSNIVFRIHKCSHHIALLSWSGVSFWSNLPFWDLPWKGWELSYKFITTALVVVAVVGDTNPYQTEATSAEFFSCGFLHHTYIFVAESLVDEVSWLSSSSPQAVLLLVRRSHWGRQYY